jgi:hypothetical protein
MFASFRIERPGMKNQRIGIGPCLTIFAVGARRSNFFLAIGVGLCCSVGLLLTTGDTLHQAGYIDPYVYVGYIHDYHGLLNRFGPTYYSTRIAYIYPERALAYLFGLQGGYLAFRLLALASAVAAVFAIGMRFYGYAPAILAAVWLSFVPWLPRSLFWTYPDGIAVVYLLVGIAFLIVPTKRRLAYHFAAGAAFALAINCNLILLAYCGLLGPGWGFFYRREGIVWLARALCALAVGFFATYLLMTLLLYVQFPAYGFLFELVSIRTAISLIGGEGLAWYQPLSSIIWQGKNFTLLIPVTFVFAALSLVTQCSRIERTQTSDTDFEVFAVSYLASIIGFSLLLHFGFQDASLSQAHYISYFVPGSVLALIVLGGAIERRGGRVLGKAVVFGGAALILLGWLAHPVLPHLKITESWYFWLAVAAVTVVAALALRRIAAVSVVLLAGAVLLSSSLFQAGSKFYDIRDSRSESKLEWDVYDGAIFLQQFVNAHIPPRARSIGFWYSGKEEFRWEVLNSIQSVYLWKATRVFPMSAPGMPSVDEQFRNDVAGRRFLFLLGLSDAETNSGLAALEAADLPFREVSRAHFQGQLWEYTAVLVEMKSSVTTPGLLLFNIPLARLELDPMAARDGSISLSPLGDELRLITAARQWTNSLRVRLRPLLESVHGQVVLRVRLKVDDGTVGIHVSTSGNAILNSDIVVDVTREAREVYLKISDVAAAEWLFIRNESPGGQSHAIVYSVDVLRSP